MVANRHTVRNSPPPPPPARCARIALLLSGSVVKLLHHQPHLLLSPVRHSKPPSSVTDLVRGRRLSSWFWRLATSVAITFPFHYPTMATPLNPKRTHGGISRKNRQPEAVLAARGVTDEDFARTEAASAFRKVKLLAGPTEQTHKRVIEYFKKAMHHEIKRYEREGKGSYLLTCSGSPVSVDAMFSEGAPFPSRKQTEAFLYFRANTGIGQVNEKISIQTIKQDVLRFVFAFRRMTGTVADAEQISQSLAYIDGNLMKELGLERGKKFRPIPDGKILAGECSLTVVLISCHLLPFTEPHCSPSTVNSSSNDGAGILA
jgi:hypothetical protein